MPSFSRTATVTIASGQSLSAAVALGAGVPLAMQIPAAITGTELTVQGSLDGITYTDIFDSGVELSIPVLASQNVVLPASALAGFSYFKFRSGTASVPTNQGAARTLVLHNRVDF